MTKKLKTIKLQVKKRLSEILKAAIVINSGR